MAIAACVAACALQADRVGASVSIEPEGQVEFFEASGSQSGKIAALVESQEVFLSLPDLVSRLGLVRKALPGGRVGICRGDLCLPFERGAGPDGIRVGGDVEYVPVRRLLKGLGGTYLWVPARKLMLMDLTNRASLFLRVAKAVDFTLPDLEGRPVSLVNFRGKKVILFAWASW